MIYSVDRDITVASTIESAFYRDEAAYALTRERIFACTWQWIGDLADVAAPGALSPRELLPLDVRQLGRIAINRQLLDR